MSLLGSYLLERPVWVEGEREMEKMGGGGRREGEMPLCLAITYRGGDRVSGKSSLNPISPACLERGDKTDKYIFWQT